MLRGLLINIIIGVSVIVTMFMYADLIVMFVGAGFESSVVLIKILLLGQLASILVGPVILATSFFVMERLC